MNAEWWIEPLCYAVLSMYAVLVGIVLYMGFAPEGE